MVAFLAGMFAGRKNCVVDHKSYNDYPAYSGSDLGINYSPEFTTFKIWSPVANEVLVHLYAAGHGDNRLQTYSMEPDVHGTWALKIKGDQKGKYYTFQVKVEDRYLKETPGIYSIAVGVNGQRSMVIDMEETNPPGWDTHQKPKLDSPNDIIIYELHVRDMTIHESSGSSFPGKYLGLVENGTKSKEGNATGIDHMKELGITHVHLLPVFDYHTIDETRLEKPQFNWGYDPVNYNVPEGSYSSDPYLAEVRIKEFKEMVMRFHEQGIRVIMDVVYNHTYDIENSNFNQEVPGYYYRQDESGGYSDASGCGNETASERAMVRKFIIESCTFWAKEYKIDGFRFDLMGIHDIETINLLSSELKKIDPAIFVYGEGWTGGSSPLPESLRALKHNTLHLTDVAAFSDDIRDAIKGNVFDKKSIGFVSGARDLDESIKFGVVASTMHPQIDFSLIHYSEKPWANRPSQTIGYVSCHDNNTLSDKLVASCPEYPVEEIKKMHKLANAIVLTSQSIPFLHAGVEMMRTKDGEHNSFNLSDDINQIEWDWKMQHHDVVDYYKGLIALRKNHPAFRMGTTEMITDHLSFFDMKKAGVVGYQISGAANGDSWEEIIVIYNAGKEDYIFELPEGTWQVAVKDTWIVNEGIEEVMVNVEIPPISMMVLFQENRLGHK